MEMSFAFHHLSDRREYAGKIEDWSGFCEQVNRNAGLGADIQQLQFFATRGSSYSSDAFANVLRELDLVENESTCWAQVRELVEKASKTPGVKGIVRCPEPHREKSVSGQKASREAPTSVKPIPRGSPESIR